MPARKRAYDSLDVDLLPPRLHNTFNNERSQDEQSQESDRSSSSSQGDEDEYVPFMSSVLSLLLFVRLLFRVVPFYSIYSFDLFRLVGYGVSFVANCLGLIWDLHGVPRVELGAGSCGRSEFSRLYVRSICFYICYELLGGFIAVKLSDIRKEVQCPICLGIIKKTRTVMECLHRFCRECIDKSMRLGNKECPACRTHCASRRSLRDDPNYDTLIAVLYPDIEKYEEEELAFQEEEKARNKQIQTSIAQTLQRQTESLGRKRSKPSRRLSSRGPKSFQNHIESLCFDENEDENDYDVSKNSSSADERMDTRPKRPRRGGPVRFSQSSSATGADGADVGGIEHDYVGASLGLVGSSEKLSWGKGGIRSHTRYGGTNGGAGKNSRNNRIAKLSDYVRNSENVSEEELDIHVLLVSMDRSIPALQRPYICCRPSVMIGHLSQYVALETALSVDVVEICVANELQMKLDPSTSEAIKNPSKESVQILNEQETLSTAKLKAHRLACGYLLLAYKKKG
ncbi:putative E3 ubiquitin-protein ligase RING1a [Cucumis melo var. makuwa]|uniref:Putative E3 ubiquitin-protein ligase RING1a n=1 Tax=Cucumis melo var. makuwa TaxID=1194695 RepID=A0A5D3CNZ3_CUCMM|nr:putative E3 ubiquitin-protein ligase RING1a [Cucumis melo var. makuwa]